MGLFSRSNSYIYESASVLSDIDTPSIYEGKYDWSDESTYNLIAENVTNYNNIMKAVGIEELACFENGETFVLEAEGKSFFGSIIAFLKNIWEKIKGIFRKFIAAFDSMSKSNKDFINKYKKYLLQPNVTKDFKYKGFKFTHIDDVDTAKVDTNTVLDSLPKISTGNNTYSFSLDSLDDLLTKAMNKDGTDGKLSKTDFDKFNTKKNETEENWDDTLLPKIRGSVYTKFTGDTKTDLEADELSEALFERFRDGNKEKELLDSDDINISDIISQLSTTDHIRKTTNRALDDTKKSMDRDIKSFEKLSDKAIKAFPGKELDQEKKNSIEQVNYIASAVSRGITAIKNNFIICQNAWLKAIDDRAKQNKAICVALVNRGTNVKTESYDYYTNEGGYLGNVKLI